MALTPVPSAPASRRPTAEAVLSAVKELQRLRCKIATGAAANANITVTGIATADQLVGVIRLDVAADSGTSATGNKVQDVSDLLAEASITAADTIRLSTTDTSGDKLLVLYFDVA